MLHHPIKTQVLERTGTKHFRIGASSMQGYRDTMEDAHTIKTTFGKEKTSCFLAVYDGHANKKAAKWCEKHFHHYLPSHLEDYDEKTVKKAVLEADAAYRKTNNEESAAGGCTAVFTLITPKKNGVFDLIVGNVGDSRILKGNPDGSFQPLTRDHKPTDSEEKERIEQAGGLVLLGRVNGSLAVSRAIGDFDFKEVPGLSPTEQKVTAVPDLYTSKAKEGDFLLVSCDGLFERLSDEEVMGFISRKLRDKEVGKDPAKILQSLLDHCVENSMDNLSAILLLFQNGEGYGEENEELILGPILSEEKEWRRKYVKDLKQRGYTPTDVANDGKTKAAVR